MWFMILKNDPLILEVSGDLLGTGGRTTLGADDGIGVALGLTIMENPPASHPELELLLTTDEEDTFSGAAAVDFFQDPWPPASQS